MGSGGVGGLFGARLAASGADVRFIARGRHLAAIKQDGLIVESEHCGDLKLAVEATDDPGQVGHCDYVLFCVKLWDTEAACQAIAPMVGKMTTIISFQNGIERDQILQDAFGADKVAGGISYVAATIKQPGVITQKGHVQKLVFGEYSGEQSSRLFRFAYACRSANIEVEMPADIRQALWYKFICLVAMSSMTAATRLPIGPVRNNAKTRSLTRKVMEEVKAVGLKSGVSLESDIVDRQMAYLDGLAADVTASLEYDLRTGNKLELPYLAGYVVELGDRLGVDTPSLDTICALLDPYVDWRPVIA